jgi:indolepyruvate ferredoxin oxidoreductase
MAQWMDRSTLGFTQMGGEGANWIGEAPFSRTPHVFQNIGDGTYNHSGYMALRASIASGVNVTYKILYNDAVAMTGGQMNDGNLTVPKIAAQVAAEGARRVVVVSDEPKKYPPGTKWPEGITFHHRDDLQTVQKTLAEIPGCTVLIYDQTCAAEKRRRRKRGTFPDPDKRVIINELVCEGCGDCGVKSNCVSILPVETDFGRKRMIDQSSCNQDYFCIEGFCPSFVTVKGGQVKKSKAARDVRPADFPEVPAPVVAASKHAQYNILITGIGGTGVITIGALLGMAAHLEQKGTSALDMTGMSQKNGAVTSHVRIARTPDDIHAQRIATGEANLILGCDMLTAGAFDAIAKTRPGRTTAVINLHEQPPGQFAQNPDWQFPGDQIRALIEESVGGSAHFIPATRLATALMGDSIATNLFMLGFAFQKGLIPLQQASILHAIELNAVAVDANKRAFEWGRRAAVDLTQVERIAVPSQPVVMQMPQSLDQLLARRVAFLTSYQNAAYAQRYAGLVEKVRAAEAAAVGGDTLTKAVARYLFKLMAYKDEYEVARLYTDGEFERRLNAAFEGDFKIKYNLAPPLLAKRDASGKLVKAQYGAWMRPAFSLLARLRFLRGTALDVFGRTEERRIERRLIRDYETVLDEILPTLSRENHAIAVALAVLPERIRGFGHVKLRHLEEAAAEQGRLLDRYRSLARRVEHAA